MMESVYINPDTDETLWFHDQPGRALVQRVQEAKSSQATPEGPLRDYAVLFTTTSHRAMREWFTEYQRVNGKFRKAKPYKQQMPSVTMEVGEAAAQTPEIPYTHGTGATVPQGEYDGI